MTQPGRLIAVVGPSGVGKDSLMAALVEARPSLSLVRRVITRAADKGGEDFDAVSEAEFATMAAADMFALHWHAHNLRYGIRRSTIDAVLQGSDMLINLSRGVLRDAGALVPDFVVVNVTARPETLAARLRGRGRETPEDIAARLARSVKPLPEDLNIIELSNDGALQDTVQTGLAILFPEDAPALSQ